MSTLAQLELPLLSSSCLLLETWILMITWAMAAHMLTGTQLDSSLLSWYFPYPVCQQQTLIYRDIKSLDAKLGTVCRQFDSVDFLKFSSSVFLQNARTKARSITSRENLPFGGSHPPRTALGNNRLPCNSLLKPMQLGFLFRPLVSKKYKKCL